MSGTTDNADRIDRAQERLRIAARLYQLGQREPSDDLADTAVELCHGARIMAEGEGRRELAFWALRCAEVAEGVE